MNKETYRLVWSPVRNMLVAVGETATAHGNGATIAPERHPAGLRRFTLFAMRHAAFAALALFGLAPVVAHAQIVPSGAQAPNVISTANGVPQVNVRKPSAAGVSLNTYSQFDVQKNGAILNNSPVITNTQLAGQINGNPNFAPNDAAKIIVNQVNSNNPSQLRGYVEVAGQRTAAVVIANPSGLVVDGGGFINTTRGVLTTGNPLIDANGNLAGFNVAAGRIAVEGAGLNASNIDQVDLIARAVQANAAIYGNTLNVVAGPNNVDFASLNATPTAGTGAVPGVSIDVSQLGGMWADRIVLVGNERGVGVNNAGVISAQAGDLTLTSAGQLVQSGQMTASGNLAIDAASVANAGTIYAQQAVTLATSGVLANSGTLAAQADLTATAGSVASTGVLGAGIHSDGSSGSSGNLTVTAAGLLSATGQNVAPGNVTLHGVSLDLSGARNWAGAALDLAASGGYLSLANATTGAGSAITARAAGTLDNSGGTLNAPQLVLQAGDLANRNGSIAQTGTGATTIAISGTLDNTGGTLATNSEDLTLTPGTLVNDRGTITAAGTGTLSVSTGALSNNGGTIATNGSETIEARSIANAGGALSAAGSERVTATDGGIDNSAGGYIGGDSLAVSATSGDINNAGGTLEALSGPASVSAQSIANDRGVIHALGAAALSVRASQRLGNRGGLIGGNQAVTVSAGTLDNTGGTLVAAGDLSARSSGAFTNDGGTVAASGDVDVGAGGGLSNAGGQIAAAGTNGRMRVSGASIDNTNGAITNAGTGALAVTAAQTVTNAGTSGIVAGNGDVTLAAATLSNTQGAAVSAVGALSVNVSQRLANDGGKLASGGALSLDAASASATNTGGSISGGTVTLATASLDNGRGEISNYAGSGGNVAIQTGALGNAGGSIGSSADLSVSAATLQGDGQIVAGRDANVSLQGDFTHGAGNRITANRNLTFTTGGTLTNEGAIGAAGNATVSAANIVNAAGATIGSGDPGDLTGGATTVNAAGAIANAGTIEGNTVTTRSATLTNTGTVIGRDVTVNAGTLVNDGAAAIIAGAHEVNLWAGNTLTNQNNATLYSLGDLNIAADGTKDAHGNLVNASGTINNLSSTIQAGGDLNVTANQINNVRENIRTTTTSETQTYLMKELPWFQPSGANGRPGASGPFTDANTIILDAYYVDPADIVSVTPVVTPDGYIVQKVVVNLPADASVFEWKQSGLSYALPNGGSQVQYGEQSRLTPEAGQVTLYVHGFDGGQANPDQAGGSAWSRLGNYITQNLLGTITYSSQYGDCTTNCIRLETYPDYNDPTTQMLKDTERRRGGSGPGSLPVEVQREATQTITATTLSPDSGAPAILTSGGAMNLRVGAQLNNDNGTIAAGGDLTVNGAAGASSAAIRNTATELDTTYSFVNRSGYGSPWNADPNQPVEWVQWTNPSITMATGTAGGTITSNQAVTITGGEIANTGVRASSVPGGATAPAGLAAPALADAGSGTVRNVGGARAENLAVTLPTNGLYSINTAPDAAYLVVTDPRFTSYTKFISSDYMLGQLGLDPQSVAKRLGDGLYEQQQVQNQITQLTGRVYLQGYDNSLAEYQALMTSGVTFAQQFGLEPGMALTDAQMAALTADIVWLVNQSVTLPDGSTQTVLVPQVYLAASSHANLQPAGALIAGDTVAIQGDNVTNRSAAIAANGNVLVVANNNIQNLGGLIAGANVGLAAGNDIVNASVTSSESSKFGTGTSSHVSVAQVGQIVSSGDMVLQAGHDLTVTGAQVNAGGSLGMSAGHAVNIGTVRTGDDITTTAASGNTTASSNTRENGSSIAAGGNLGVVSGGDIGVTGSDLKSGGNTVIAAAGDVSIKNATNSESTRLHGTNDSGWQDYQLSRESNRAGTVSAGGDVTVLAGAQQDANGNLLLSASGTQKHLNIEGSAIAADGAATLGATGDVNVQASQQQSSMSDTWHQSSSNLISHTTTDSQSTFVASNATGSLVSGDTVSVAAGHDVRVKGSDVVGTGDVALAAGHDVSVTTSQDTATQTDYYHQSKSGLMGTGGIGVTVGTRSQKDANEATNVTNNGSLVGSLTGSVSLSAGNDLHVTGSDLVAAQNITGTGATVTLDAAQGSAAHNETHESKQSGVSLGLAGSVGDAINAVVAQSQAIAHSAASGNGRATALHGIAAAGNAAFAAMGAMGLADGASGPQAPSIGVQVSIGSSKSESRASERQTTNVGSSAMAGGTVGFVATQGDVTVAGSNVSGSDVLLAAQQKVNVVNTTDTDSTRSSNKSSSASVGVSLTTQGWGVSAAMSNAHGDGNSDAAIQNASHVAGSNGVAIVSGGDTNVIGSQVSGGTVAADVGGNLNIQSVQDVTTSAAHQSSVGGGFSISQGGGSASFSAQNGHANGNYAQVGEQAAIRAGDGGFDITVKGNTDLKGAVISSTADAEMNTLTTGTLTFSDIENHSEYSASSSGFSAGGGLGATGKATGPGSVSGSGGVIPTFASDSGSESVITKSAVSAGTIVITDQANQAQDVATLSRDTTDTNGTVSNLPDVQGLLGQQADLMGGVQAAGQVVAQAIGTYADGKRKDAQGLADAAAKAGNPELAAQYQAQADSWAEGGKNRIYLHVAGGALLGGLGGGGFGTALQGAAGAGLSAGMAKGLDSLSKGIADETGSAVLGNIAANIVAGVGGALVGGGMGATTAANADLYNRQLHPDERKWAKDNAKEFAAFYEGKTGLAITVEQAENMLLANGYRLVDAYASKGPGGDRDAIQYISEKGGGLFIKDQYYNDPFKFGNADHSLTAEQRALPGAIANPKAGLVIAGGLVTAGLAPEIVAGLGSIPGAPIFSSGGALGSVALASPVGTGAISAGINAGSQYVQNGSINPVDLAGAFGTGAAGSYGGLLWNVGVNAFNGSATTAINNILQGKNDSVIGAGITGGIFSMVGYVAGSITANTINSLIRPTIGNAGSWAGSGVWSGSGYNLFNPNNTAVISGGFTGGTLQEIVQGVINKAQSAGTGK